LRIEQALGSWRGRIKPHDELTVHRVEAPLPLEKLPVAARQVRDEMKGAALGRRDVQRATDFEIEPVAERLHATALDLCDGLQPAARHRHPR